ncbi:hypothetical protein Slin14017_G098590 [Septoria linicola]|nr:hypothetical protein Slin14017_G098590 [Septoria linicola]
MAGNCVPLGGNRIYYGEVRVPHILGWRGRAVQVEYMLRQEGAHRGLQALEEEAEEEEEEEEEKGPLWWERSAIVAKELEELEEQLRGQWVQHVADLLCPRPQ